jgi:hypothetical protein
MIHFVGIGQRELNAFARFHLDPCEMEFQTRNGFDLDHSFELFPSLCKGQLCISYEAQEEQELC